jgi:hypothetical protein
VGLTRDVHYSKIKVTELIPGKKVVVGLLHRRQSAGPHHNGESKPTPNPDEAHFQRNTCRLDVLRRAAADGSVV